MDEKAQPNYIPQIERIVQLCPPEDVDKHLRAFINAFVYPDAKARWQEFLVDKRSIWNRDNLSAAHIRKLYEKVNTLLNSFAPYNGTGTSVDRNKLPAGWYERNYGTKTGLLFMPRMPACIVTPLEAHIIANFYDDSCILSLTPG